MAGGHAVRGVLTAWLGLIVLETVATKGSGRVGSAFTDLNTLVSRALDPSVPAIPDRRAGHSSSPSAGATANPSGTYRTPADLMPGLPIGSMPIPARNIR